MINFNKHSIIINKLIIWKKKKLLSWQTNMCVLGHCAVSFSISINRGESSERGVLLSSVPNPHGPSLGLSRHSFRQSHRGPTSATNQSPILLSNTIRYNHVIYYLWHSKSHIVSFCNWLKHMIFLKEKKTNSIFVLFLSKNLQDSLFTGKDKDTH